MSDNTESTATDNDSAVSKQESNSSNHDLPDWARSQISKANQEAANYRVQLRESEKARQSLEEQVVSLSTDKESTSSVLSAVQGDFDRLVTAIQAEVPHSHVFAFAKTLQGSNTDELAAHANELKEMFNLSRTASPAVDRSQGHGATASATPADEFAALLKSNLSR